MKMPFVDFYIIKDAFLLIFFLAIAPDFCYTI